MSEADGKRYYRMMKFLIKGGTKMTRKLFEKRVQDLKHLDPDPKTPWSVDKFLNLKRDRILDSKKGREKENIYFPGVCDKTNLESWDLIMFCFILTRVCELPPSITRDIEELRDMRNELCHMSEPCLNKSAYKKKLRNAEVIADNICKETNDANFEREIKDFFKNLDTDDITVHEVLKLTHNFYHMGRETKAILTEVSKDSKEILRRIEGLETMYKSKQSTDAAGVKLPETDIEIVVQNCNKDKEKKLSELLVKLIDEQIHEKTTLAENLSNENMSELRKAVAQAVEIFLANGRTITSTEKKCILVRVQATSIGNLVKLFQDCISGELTDQIKPLEKAVRKMPGFEEISLEAIIYEDEFWKVMWKTISILEEYMKAEDSKPRASVSQCSSLNAAEGTSLELSIQYRSAKQHDSFRDAYERGELDRHMKNIQDAAGPEYSDVTIKARLKTNKIAISPKVHLSSPEDYYGQAEKPAKRDKRRKTDKTKCGMHFRDARLDVSPRNVMMSRHISAEVDLSADSESTFDNSSYHFTDSGIETSLSHCYIETQMGIESMGARSKHRSDYEKDKCVSAGFEDNEEFDLELLSQSNDDHHQRVSDFGFFYQNGIKLNESFLAMFKAKSPKYKPFYQPFQYSQGELRDMVKMQPQKYAQGTLYLKGSQEAVCIPNNNEYENFHVQISGRAKIGRSFNLDEVVVELFGTKENEMRFGKVVGIVDRKIKVKHPVFLCTPDGTGSQNVRPMCNSVPKLHTVHDSLRQKKKHRKAKKHCFEIYEYDERAEILGDSVIEELSPSAEKSCVFLVALISWEVNQIYPIGAIIKRIPCGDNVERGVAILNKLYQIAPDFSEEAQSVVDSCVDKEIENNDEVIRRDKTSLHTFTIESSDCKDFNYAFSVEKDDGYFLVGVHIVDVAAYVTKGSPLDQEARMRSRSIHTNVGKPRYMLPDDVAEVLCSLIENQKRPTISFSFCLDENGNSKLVDGQPFRVENTFIKCRRNLSYNEALQISSKDDILSSALDTIFKLMKRRRISRLGASMHVLNEDEIKKEETEKGSKLVQCFVEELIIMVNEKVATFLHHNGICIPSYSQRKPSDENLSSILKKYGQYLNVVVNLQNKEISTNQRAVLDDIMQNSKLCVIATKSVWKEMNSSVKVAAEILLDDNKHPLQCVIHQKWLRIQQKPCYVSSSAMNNKAHFSLGLEMYTHCTMPSRRYVDLVIQRLLCAWIANKSHSVFQSPYSFEEIEDICIQANSLMNDALNYEMETENLFEAVQLKTKTNLITCFVSDISDRSIHVIDTSSNLFRKKEIELPFNLFDMAYRPSIVLDKNTNLERVEGKWRKRFYDLNNYLQQQKPKYDSANDRFDDVTTKITNHDNHFEVLNHNRDVVFINLHHWAGLVKTALGDYAKDLKGKLRKTVANADSAGVDDITTECRNESEILANTKFSYTFYLGQPLTLQMTAEPREGLIKAKPMLLQVTNTINLCLQHIEDPVFHLTDCEAQPSLEQYRNVKHYSNTWIPIVLMEAAESAIRNEDNYSIDNVDLLCENDNRGSFNLPVGFCEERNVKLSGTVHKRRREIDDDDFSYDWLCIKYYLPRNKHIKDETNRSIWIGHAKIVEVSKRNDHFVVRFDLHVRSGKFPTGLIQKGGGKVSVEVLRKTDVDRRVESYLHIFSEQPETSESSSVKIALKRKFQALDDDHESIARQIKCDQILPSLPKNNKSQQAALDLALRNRFTLIQGPPGTGKTSLGIKLICLFDMINKGIATVTQEQRTKQVLFCGPSNKSVDLVAKWLLSNLGQRGPNFIRVYGQATETRIFPIPGVAYSAKGSGTYEEDKDLKSVSLHYLIRQRGIYADKINELDAFFQSINCKRWDKQTCPSYKLTEARWTELKKEPLKELIKKYKMIVKEACMKEIKNHNVILCTTGVGSNPKILQAADVYQVIIDEAGMCPEPQCMVPLIATKAEQVVLIGDHKQLRPIVRCKAAAELGLERSLFERYAMMKDSSMRFIMLDEQYRMNPALCEFPSREFYDGKLQTRKGPWDKNVLDIWPKDINTLQPYPHILIHVEGQEEVLAVSTDEANEQSRSNAAEIEKVIHVYKYFIDEGVDAKSVNIISQYNSQCHEIQKSLKRERLNNYVVNTVVSSQGGEWDYVIFSTVRSLPKYKIEVDSTLGWQKQNLGFITDTNQINVALTRARKGLVIIGNKHLLSCDPVWKRLISYYEQRKCVKRPEDFPPPLPASRSRLSDFKKRNQQAYGHQGKH